MRNTPPITKNLIILNCLMLLLVYVTGGNMSFLYEYLSLFPFESEMFKPYQVITHMFMHGGILHLAFNMYTLWIFGSVLERIWGPYKFFLFYMVTGIGAALCHELVLHIEYSSLTNTIASASDMIAKAEANTRLARLLITPTVGASGAIYGVLLGYGMLFPNNRLQLVFPPVAMKAKWFVIIFGAIELLMGLTASDNVAHFAHLGGMIFGYFLILYWKTKNKMYY